jgi:hypothetical protein
MFPDLPRQGPAHGQDSARRDIRATSHPLAVHGAPQARYAPVTKMWSFTLIHSWLFCRTLGVTGLILPDSHRGQGRPRRVRHRLTDTKHLSVPSGTILI